MLTYTNIIYNHINFCKYATLRMCFQVFLQNRFLRKLTGKYELHR